MKNLQPQGVWSNFYSLTQIPRPSGKKEEVSAFLAEYGRSLGLETIVDGIGNVIIRKPASPGYENHPGVILQGHMDMVWAKDETATIDLETDPLELCISGNKLKAKGTTLGADNGIAVAMILAILESDDIAHPPIEAVFTVDEETGMIGAKCLDMSVLKGRRILEYRDD